MTVSINASGTYTVVTRATGADGETTTGWTAVKLEGAGGGPNAIQSVGSTDLFVEGSDAIETTTNKQRVLLTHSPGGSYDFTSGGTGSGTTKIPNGLFWIWGTFLASGTMFTQANGGFQIMLGDGTNRAFWNVAGSDTYLGGFKKWAISIDLANRFTTDDTGTVQIGNITEFGMVTDVGGATTRFANFVVDAYDIGTGLTFTGSTVSDSLFLESFNAQDATKIGILQNSNGIIFAQGNLEFDGTSQTSIGETMVFTDTVLDADYNYNLAFTGSHTLTNTSITGSAGVTYSFDSSGATSFTMSGGALSKINTLDFGTSDSVSNVVISDGTTINIANDPSGCSFVNNGVVALASTGTLTSCTVTPTTASTTASTAPSIDQYIGCTFVGDNTGHAVEMTQTSVDGLTFNWDCQTSGYDAGTTGSPVSTTSTGNETIYVKATTGTMTINVSSTATVPSVRSDGATVNVVAGQATLTISNVVSGSDVVIRSQGTTTKIQDDQDISGTTSTYTYTYSAGTFVDIAVYSEGYVPYFVNGYELGSASATLPVSQVVDKNYVPQEGI